MINFPDMIIIVLTCFQKSPLSCSYHIQETIFFSHEQFAFKVIAEPTAGGKFQIRIYRNRLHIDYAYHFMHGSTKIRWDNKEHFPDITTFPHHFHSNSGSVENSPLNGDISHDLPIVLNFLSDYYNQL